MVENLRNTIQSKMKDLVLAKTGKTSTLRNKKRKRHGHEIKLPETD